MLVICFVEMGGFSTRYLYRFSSFVVSRAFVFAGVLVLSSDTCVESFSSLAFVYFVERPSLPTVLSWCDFLVNLVSLCCYEAHRCIRGCVCHHVSHHFYRHQQHHRSTWHQRASACHCARARRRDIRALTFRDIPRPFARCKWATYCCCAIEGSRVNWE